MNPLDQLADISPPESVSMWPLAWGYWVLILIVLVLMVGLYTLLRRYRTHHKARKLALIQLKEIEANDKYFAHKVQIILRLFIKSYYPDKNITNVSGDEFNSRVLSIFNQCSPGNPQQNEISEVLRDLHLRLYAPQKPCGNDELEANARHIIDRIKYFIGVATPSFWKNKKLVQSTSKAMGDRAHV